MAVILPSESVLVVGMKGSGKTTLLTYLLDQLRPQGRHRAIILDTKQVGDFKKYPTVTELSQLHKYVEKYPKVCYSPNKAEVKDPAFHEGFFAWAYDRHDTTLIVDELTSIVWGNDVPDSYKDVTDRGRAKRVTIWQGNQKPVFVPHAALSESDHFFMFDMLMEGDRKKMSTILGGLVMQRPPDPFGFWYYHKTLKDPVYVPGLKI